MMVRRYLLITLLGCSGAGWTTQGLAQGELVSKTKGTLQAMRAGMQRVPLLVAVASSLLLVTPSLPAQDDADISTDIDFDPTYEWVQEGDPAHRLSVLYLRAYTPERDMSHLHPLVYLGDNANGDAVFFGMLLRGHEHDWLSIWGRDGLVQNEVEDKELAVFADPLRGWGEVNIFVAKGLQGLAGDYVPARVARFPLYDIGKELEMLAWGNSYGELPLTDLRLAYHKCHIRDPQGWGRVGVALHSCRPSWLAERSPFGSPIFNEDTGEMVGFYIAETSTAYRAETAREEVIEFIEALELDRAIAAPPVTRTTPAMWGELKSTRH